MGDEDGGSDRGLALLTQFEGRDDGIADSASVREALELVRAERDASLMVI